MKDSTKIKPKVPLIVLEILEPYLNKKSEYFKIIYEENKLLKFVALGEFSNFYFCVEEYKTESKLKLLIDVKPENKSTIENGKHWIEYSHLDVFFKNWVSILERYNTVKTTFEDPIVESYANEYFSEFDFVDDDANTKLFSDKQLLLLDSYLENIEATIDEYSTDSNKANIEEIRNDVVELRNELTSSTKKIVLKKLTKIWGKLSKQGIKLMKDFVIKGKDELIKIGVKYLIDELPKLL